MSRYTKLAAKGLYKENSSGKYYCQKKINKIPYSKTFDSITEAKFWLKNFDPEKPRFKVETNQFKHLNGSVSMLCRDAWKEYKIDNYGNHELSTAASRHERMDKFVEGILHLNMQYLSPEVIDNLILESKKVAHSKRLNFNYELDHISCFFAWYIREHDFYFKTPLVMKRHKPKGVIVKTIKKDKKRMRIEHTIKFLNSLKTLNKEDGKYFKFAFIQFLTASRAQDVAGLSKSQLDFEFNEIDFNQALSWPRGKNNKPYLKPQKNGEDRIAGIQEDMKTILLELFNKTTHPKDILFTGNEPDSFICYYKIRRAYNAALEHAKLDHLYTGTHIMRRAMARATRETFKSIDHVQAITGHKDVLQAEHYSGKCSSLQKEVVEVIGERLKLVQ